MWFARSAMGRKRTFPACRKTDVATKPTTGEKQTLWRQGQSYGGRRPSSHRTDESITMSRPRTTAVSSTRPHAGAHRKPKNRTFLPTKMYPHPGQQILEDAAGNVKPLEVATPPQSRELRPSKCAEHLGQVSNPFITPQYLNVGIRRPGRPINCRTARLDPLRVESGQSAEDFQHILWLSKRRC